MRQTSLVDMKRDHGNHGDSGLDDAANPHPGPRGSYHSGGLAIFPRLSNGRRKGGKCEGSHDLCNSKAVHDSVLLSWSWPVF